MKKLINLLYDDGFNRILTIIALLLLVVIIYLDQGHPQKLYFFGGIAKTFIFSLVSYLCFAFIISAIFYMTTNKLTAFEICLAKNIVPFIFILVLIRYALAIFI